MPKRSPSILGGRGRGARQAWRIFRTRLVQRWFQRLRTGFSVSQHRPQRIDRCTAAWLQRKRRNDPARARSKAKRCEASPLAPGREADLITIFKEGACRSEEHTSELQSLMRISYAVFCLKKKKQ